MENPFKQIIENQQVPETIRKKVIDDIKLIKLFLDMADLVAVKYPLSIIKLFDTTVKKNNKKNNK